MCIHLPCNGQLYIFSSLVAIYLSVFFLFFVVDGLLLCGTFSAVHTDAMAVDKHKAIGKSSANCIKIPLQRKSTLILNRPTPSLTILIIVNWRRSMSADFVLPIKRIDYFMSVFQLYMYIYFNSRNCLLFYFIIYFFHSSLLVRVSFILFAGVFLFGFR